MMCIGIGCLEQRRKILLSAWRTDPERCDRVFACLSHRTNLSCGTGVRLNAPGADLVVSFSAKPGEGYYFEVGSYYGMTAGAYKLTMR